ncbi:hypothetical protein [Lacipirellula sp.]|uniref:hypothetical protein n=1 Tax=Lacipirellula sp. TaxID=2691419 RepID=UPI003D12B2EC
MPNSAVATGNVIVEGQMYDLAALKPLGWGTAAIRAARRKHGLVTHRCGRKTWIDGRELIRVIKASAVPA